MTIYETKRTEEQLEFRGEWCTRVSYEDPIPGKDVGHVSKAIYVVGCIACEREKAANEVFFPSHWPSSYCQSGSRPHCTCDACF